MSTTARIVGDMIGQLITSLIPKGFRFCVVVEGEGSWATYGNDGINGQAQLIRQAERGYYELELEVEEKKKQQLKVLS